MTSELNRREFRMPLFIPLVVCLALAGCSTYRPPTAPLAVQKFDAVKEVKYPWGWIRWLMNAELDPAATQTFGIVQIEAGQRNPFHKHPNCEELIYVVSGSVEQIVAGQRVMMHEGGILRIPADIPHQAINHTQEPVRTVVVYNTGARQMVTLDTPAE